MTPEEEKDIIQKIVDVMGCTHLQAKGLYSIINIIVLTWLKENNEGLIKVL